MTSYAITLEQENKINELLVAICKSYVLLEVELIACIGALNLDSQGDIYKFTVNVLAYRGVLDDFWFNKINTLAGGDLEKPEYLIRSKTNINQVGIISKGATKC